MHTGGESNRGRSMVAWVALLAWAGAALALPPLGAQLGSPLGLHAGFIGLRGKREAFDPAGLPPEDRGAFYEKKAQLDRFVGFRGKKTGFQAFRGKKDDRPDYYDDPEEKRAGFVGFRGKKTPGFLGVRGKKDPGDPAAPFYADVLGTKGRRAPAGFLGMRGKKSDSGRLQDFLREVEDLMERRFESGTETESLPGKSAK